MYNDKNEKWFSEMSLNTSGFNKFRMELREMNVNPPKTENLKENTTY